jgi:hypothetical protein
VLVAALVGLVAACSSHGGGSTVATSPRPSASATASTTGAVHLQVGMTRWRLASPLSRPVVLARGRDLVVAGGLQAGDQSRAQVTTIDPSSGRVVGSGSLATPVHDAAGALLANRAVVFGGGSSVSLATVQTAESGAGRSIAQLPAPRSDLTSVTSQGTAYLIGGYDGTVFDRSVLATTDGRTFASIATLPIGVRYAAAATVGDSLWVFGGERNGAPVTAVQQVALTDHTASVSTHLPMPLSHAAAAVIDGRVYLIGGRTTGDHRVALIWSFDPATQHFQRVARLPYGVSDAGITVIGHSAYLVGGETPSFSSGVIRVRAVAAGTGALTQSGDPAPTAHASSSPSLPAWLAPAHGRGSLAPGSDPSVLPGPILIADKYNNRLVIVDPYGRVLWQFPRPGDLPAGDTFQIPDDAFFSPDGAQIIATEEDDYVVSVIDPARHLLLYRYGVPGVPGSGPNRLNNPDDAFLLPNHDIVTADIKNCRVLHIRQGAAHATNLFGTTGSCYHDPPRHLGSPNGAFPMRNGDYLVTEIQGSWVDEITPSGHVVFAVQVPGVSYPSDANQLPGDRLLTVDYNTPGQVIIFGPNGHVFWRYAPAGAHMLRQPSLARPLPNGDILITDDGNHRVIVVDPRTNRIVWQYGHTGVPGRGPGFLNHPDGLDLMPPHQLAAVMLRAH